MNEFLGDCDVGVIVLVSRKDFFDGYQYQQKLCLSLDIFKVGVGYWNCVFLQTFKFKVYFTNGFMESTVEKNVLLGDGE